MSHLKPRDVAVALQLVLEPDATYRLLADLVGVSQGEAHNAVKRLTHARLVDPDTRSVNRQGLLDFLSHGVPYAFAADAGPDTRGVPTAHSAPPLADDFANAPAYVWPALNGTVRGQAVPPLYPAAPATSRENPPLYEALALVDALRVGRARERSMALAHLRTRLHLRES